MHYPTDMGSQQAWYPNSKFVAFVCQKPSLDSHLHIISISSPLVLLNLLGQALRTFHEVFHLYLWSIVEHCGAMAGPT